MRRSRVLGLVARAFAAMLRAGTTSRYEEEAIKRLSDQRERKLLRRIFAVVGSHDRFLDLPSGTGRLFPAIQIYGKRFVETDVSREMLKLAARTWPSGGPTWSRRRRFTSPTRAARSTASSPRASPTTFPFPRSATDSSGNSAASAGTGSS